MQKNLFDSAPHSAHLVWSRGSLTTSFGLLLLLPDTGGIWLAYAITIYSFFLMISSILFGNVLLLAGMTWGMVRKAHGRQSRVKLWGKIPIDFKKMIFRRKPQRGDDKIAQGEALGRSAKYP